MIDEHDYPHHWTNVVVDEDNIVFVDLSMDGKVLLAVSDGTRSATCTLTAEESQRLRYALELAEAAL